MNTEFENVRQAFDRHLAKLTGSVQEYNSLYQQVRGELLAVMLRRPLMITIIDGANFIEDGGVKFTITETEMSCTGDTAATDGLRFRWVPRPNVDKPKNLTEGLRDLRHLAHRQIGMEEWISELKTVREMIPTD